MLLVALFAFASCSKDNDINTDQELKKALIDEKTTPGGVRVKLWADSEDLRVSWNKLYVSLKTSSGANLTNASVTYKPVMDMMTMAHSSPAEQPVYNAEQSLYEGAVVFSMPSGTMGSWTLTVSVNNEPVVFDIVVKPAAANTKHTAAIVGSDGISYTVALIQPFKPKTGINDLQILINKRQDMMNFPAVEDLSVELKPEMPSMGHGSPNNVNPVHTGKGHYSGKVNFTMTGDWRLHFKLKRGNAVIVEDITLDLLF
ncbi:YtkA-like protein [Arcticibacter pallidicorallinus]|uniref:YtkA-like protein n=2 Tax=Arcticibacter pallidicorallinus TaxID=1259464 RepID=A0A2T0UBB5_9SPHI|nr:YtkA-like protein [Arcticibacter pallidicorallinus]